MSDRTTYPDPEFAEPQVRGERFEAAVPDTLELDRAGD